MRELILTLLIMTIFTASTYTQEVKYIETPKFDGKIYLYGEPDKVDVEVEQWYEIEGRGQFVRNVKVPALIPYLPKPKNSNGAAIIIAPGGAFLHHTFGSGGYEVAEWFKSQGFATFIPSIALKKLRDLKRTIKHMLLRKRRLKRELCSCNTGLRI